MERTAVEFSVFGRIEVLSGGRPVDLGGRMQRALLSMLLVHANAVVPTERLVDQLWAGEPTATADAALQVYVSNLRRALEPDRAPRTPPRLLVTEPPGYALKVEPGAFDVARFERLVGEGRALLAAGRVAPTRDVLTQALAMWRGTPYAELASEPWLLPEVARLDELRATAREELNEARLALGEDHAAIGDLEQVVATEPFRERGWELLALALYRTGRQAEALRTLAQLRETLTEELGLEPRPSVQKLESDILRHAPELLRSPRDAVEAPEDDGYLEVWTDRGRHLLALRGDSLTIGRSSASGLQIPDATVSRTHAVLERDTGGWSVRDAGSANGTFLNGRVVTATGHPLQPGDEVTVGSARLFFRSRAADAAAETVGPDPAAHGR
jgi:DNA-binding SARP family transcriptional activator